MDETVRAPADDRTDTDEGEQRAPVAAPLGEVLVDRGEITPEQLKMALSAQTADGRRLGEIMVELGLVSETSVTEGLAAQLGLETIDLRRARFDTEIVNLLDANVAQELCAIPVQKIANRIDVAVGDAFRDGLKQELIAALNSPVRLLVAVRREVEEAIERAYMNQAEITGALREFEERFGPQQAGGATWNDVTVDENAPIVKVVNVIFEQAVRDRASDVHIEPQEQRVRIRVRTDGALHEVLSLPLSMATPLVSRIKVMADMNIVERRRPQDGQLEVRVGDRELDVRVATAATVLGESCVLRLLDRSRALLNLTELGMAENSLRTYERLIRSPYGMVINAGPTGSGKTTTLYATLAAIQNDQTKVMTIEDPVEYVFPTINQMQINEAAGVTFAAGLRSILRQDPDSILVGEIRDVETARIAIQAALTGHFVMSSLHATDTTSALHRFIDMGIEPFLIASSLIGIASQRLVRRVCTSCAEPYEPSAEERAFYTAAGGDHDFTHFVHGAGCRACGHTGYFDRIGIYEVLTVDDTIKRMVVEHAPLGEMRAAAIDAGMSTLRQQAVDLVAAGGTTISEIIRTVYIL
jgi:type IV pilus assembly protein PilB